MLFWHYLVIFSVLAVVAGLFGFSTISGAATVIARFMFVAILVILGLFFLARYMGQFTR